MGRENEKLFIDICGETNNNLSWKILIFVCEFIKFKMHKYFRICMHIIHRHTFTGFVSKNSMCIVPKKISHAFSTRCALFIFNLQNKHKVLIYIIKEETAERERDNNLILTTLVSSRFRKLNYAIIRVYSRGLMFINERWKTNKQNDICLYF
jgi:hypothetical protein